MAPGPVQTTSPSPCAIIQQGKCPTVGGTDGESHHHQNLLQLPPYMMVNQRNSMSITNTKGLLNMPGQNNCFLNSAVQVLWHLDIFRRSFRELTGHVCMGESCIFCALKELFAQFQYSQESALPPDALRRALAETFCDQRRFQLGFMDDAAECFENILMRIHFHIANKESEDMCSARHCIPHQKFAMTLVEQTVCYACGATSEPLPFTQMVHYVPSSALCSQAKCLREKSDEVPGFGELLRRAGGLGDLRDCPSLCGTVIQIRKTLMNRPEIVSIGVVWDSERPTIEHIMDVFNTIGMTLKLQDVFHSVVDSRWASTATHQLVGIVTYYGKHYSTFFFHTKLRVWIYFDDAAVREIGPKWEQVVEKCCRGHFQPLLLLYANPYGTSVCTSTAPRNVTVVPGNKKTLNGNATFGMNLVSDKIRQNYHCQLGESQRRSLTPNPEVSCDLHSNIQPRRAVTPSAEISLFEDGNKDHHDNSKSSLDNIKPFACREDSVDTGSSELKDMYNEGKNHMRQAFNYLAHHHNLWNLQCSESNIEDVNKISGSQEKLSHAQNISTASNPKCLTYKYHFPSDTDIETPKCLDTQNFLPTRPGSVDDLLHSSALTKLVGSDCTSLIVQGLPDNTVDGKSFTYEDEHVNENAYISRKAVENVLHLQKLQRQKSMNAKHSHICVNQRNSSSSLESLENMFFLRDKGLSNFLGLKLDIPESGNVPRRRDSGNWSGDRNSASSSSTTSLDNPYFYVVGNKRPLCNGRIHGRTGMSDMVFADPGYDSFSLSSSDSYPSVIGNTSGKLDPRLGQILENQQTAFLPYDLSRLQHNTKDSSYINESHTFGFKDECEKLCMEADIFVAKSVERENVGDITMAALLSDTAAAKARAAMDAPYSNHHSLSLAKLKHSMCVIRSCNLHKKLKEAEAAQRRKQREVSANTHHNHSSSHDVNNGSFNSHKKKDSPDNLTNFGNEEIATIISHKHSDNDGYESPEKSIEIYATLPKKSVKKKGLLSFVESLTSEDNAADKISKYKTSGNTEEHIIQNGISCENDRANLKVSANSQQKTKGCDVGSIKSPGNKKKSRSTSKTGNRDSDLSDYSSEWEHTKKSSLYRTYSGPPTDSKVEFGNLAKENINQTFSGHPTKKQHKIRRKLMGGFMRRKNRSLPDLREGQDRTDAASRSFDDCAITETPVSLRKLGPQSANELQNIHSNVASQFPLQSLVSDNIQSKLTVHLGIHQDYKNPVKYTQSFSLMNTTSPPKQVIRAHTPPPYKPPPPINNSSAENDHLLQRLSSPCDDDSKHLTTPAHQSSTTDTASKTISSEPAKKQLPFIKTQPAVDCNTSSNNSAKQNAGLTKPSYNNEVPKGNVAWLKELQMKQEEIIQKRKLQEEKLKLDNENSTDSIVNSHKNLENNCNAIASAPTVLEGDNENHLYQNGNTVASSNHQINNLSNERPSLTEGCDVPKSVKDLASKFEKILKPCLQVVESSQLSLDDSSSFIQEMEENSSLASSNLCTESSGEIKSPEQVSQKNNSSSHNHDVSENESIKHPYSSRSTSGCVFNPHLTDGQLTNILRIGTNCAGFRSSNSTNVKDSSFSYSSGIRSSDSPTWIETRRPDKPPDYETAIQRLELIRGDRNLTKRVGSNYWTNFEATFSLLEQEKKKRGPKKSVTFSDKVVLVACAGDEDNDFLPNPLLERVYKQHLMRKPLPTTDSNDNNQNSFKGNSNSSTQNSTADICEAANSNTAQTPCHLCHKKNVSAPIVYCPDCAFYMSRFQK